MILESTIEVSRRQALTRTLFLPDQIDNIRWHKSNECQEVLLVDNHCLLCKFGWVQDVLAKSLINLFTTQRRIHCSKKMFTTNYIHIQLFKKEGKKSVYHFPKIIAAFK